MNSLHYILFYQNGEKHHIGDFYRTESGKYVFEYVNNPKYEFPGFDKNVKRHENDTLWEQITFRIPNNIRALNPGTRPEELLKETNGRLVTDHFQFQLVDPHHEPLF